MPARLRLALMVFASLAILAAAGVIVFTRPDSPPKLGANGFAGGLRPAIPPKDFTLRDQDGRTVSLRALRGQVVVLTFMYSTCQDTCPVTATTIRGALDDLGHDVPALAVSVDPAHDTPDSAEAFLVKRSLSGGRMHFLLGTRAQLAPIWHDYGIRPQGNGLRALRLRSAHRQARTPARQLPGRAARRPRPGPRHPQARGRARLGVGALDRRVVLARVITAALAALLDPEDDDDDEHGRQVEQRVVPVAGVCERQRGHCAAADSSQSPRLVNATMTASIQYCERVASRALL